MRNQPTLTNRFWSKVEKHDEDCPCCKGCWHWTAYCDRAGYGQYFVKTGTSQQKAHRVSYIALVGPIPDGLQIDHLCRVKGCVNPAHLEPVTNQENVIRAVGLPDTCTCGSPIVEKREGDRIRKRCVKCGHHGRPKRLASVRT
jgi:hypothetical protein